MSETTGQRLRKARKGKGFTLKQLSEKSGVPLSTISAIERNGLDPKVSQLVAIAYVLRLSLDQLAGLDVRDELKVVFGDTGPAFELWHRYLALNLEFKKKIQDEIDWLFEQQMKR
jgi:transcriptional regulator with XRE-family HTH domain